MMIVCQSTEAVLCNTEANTSNNTNLMGIEDNSKTNYFLPGPNQEADWKASAKITHELQKEF